MILLCKLRRECRAGLATAEKVKGRKKKTKVSRKQMGNAGERLPLVSRANGAD